MRVHGSLIGWRGLVAAAAALGAGIRAQEAGDPPRNSGAGEQADASSPPPRPNLVLVTLDTMRADHLGCYGYFRDTSPRIDALAQEAILFEHCYSPIPQTTPSHASLLTGVLPLEHGIVANSFRASEDVQRSRSLVTTPQLRSYAQILAEHGWRTGGFVTAATTCKVTGMAAGFEAWTEPTENTRPGEEALADALGWLAQVGTEPFFLWLHLFDVHGPHHREAPHADRFQADEALAEVMARRGIPEQVKHRGGQTVKPAVTISLYDGAIGLVDGIVDRLVGELRACGAWERTTFVLTGDHGEGLGQHEFMGHELVWNEQLRVPFLVRAPGAEPRRLPQRVSTLDVLPTAIGLTAGLPGEEFLAQARGRSAVAEDFEEQPLFALAPTLKEYALTTGRWKYVHRPRGGTDQLFDLEEDPFERKDIREEHPKIAKVLLEQIQASIRDQKARRLYYQRGGVEPEISAAEYAVFQNRLRELGYLEGDEGEEREEPEPADDGGEPPR
jgi:arylsulfatase A-like enzyme